MFELVYGQKPRTVLDIYGPPPIDHTKDWNEDQTMYRRMSFSQMLEESSQNAFSASSLNQHPSWLGHIITIDDGSRNLSIPTKDCMGLNELCLTTVSNESQDNCNKNNVMVGQVNGTGIILIHREQ